MIYKKIIKFLNLVGKLINKIIFHLNINPNLRYEYKNKFLNVYQKFTYEEQVDSYNFFKKYFYSSSFLPNNQIRDAGLKISLKNHEENDLYLEFGVYQGNSINAFSKILSNFNKNIKIFGFDSFEGLSHDWRAHRQVQGAYDLGGAIPERKFNTVYIKGRVEDTLENFLNENKNKINFVHLDLDIYEPTKFVLSKIKNRLKKNAIIVLGQAYNYSGWREGEYKALKEVFNENEFKFRIFSSNDGHIVIQIL